MQPVEAAAGPLTLASSERDAAVVARWLIGLRWAVFGVLALSLPLGDSTFGFQVIWPIAGPALALVFAVNLLARRRLAAGSASEVEVALGVAFDLVALTVVLGASGGAANPFSALFFVHVALAASLLRPRTTFLLAGLSACLFAALYVVPATRACCAADASGGAFGNHLYGMWAAFVLAAALVAYVLTRVRGALGERQREIEALRDREIKNARFASLGTLAAGTAHELATPLGTIAVLAGELERSTDPDARAHAASIRAQVARCREVITKMQAGARVAAPVETSVAGAVERAVGAWRAAHPDAEVVVDDARAGGAVVPLPGADLEAALCALLDNALHASGRRPIAVTADARGISVEDEGTGVAPDLAGRLGEPFLTTKDPGEGMGLGLFLVRSLVEQVGGRLEVAARAPHGTRVTLHLAPR